MFTVTINAPSKIIHKRILNSYKYLYKYLLQFFTHMYNHNYGKVSLCDMTL